MIKSQCLDITIYGRLFVPEAAEFKAMISGVLLSVPHQELLAWFDGLTATVVNPSSILERDKILFFTITSTVHIPLRMREHGEREGQKSDRDIIRRQGHSTQVQQISNCRNQ